VNEEKQVVKEYKEACERLDKHLQTEELRIKNELPTDTERFLKGYAAKD